MKIFFGLLVLCQMSFADDEKRTVIADGKTEATFKLTDKEDKLPTIILFDGKNEDEEVTAASINSWRKSEPPKGGGVLVVFRGIRFVRVKEYPGFAMVRLVGLKNEVEIDEPMEMKTLESGEPVKLKFGPAALGQWPVVSGETDSEMEMIYDPETGELEIPRVAGSLSWQRGLYSPVSDRGALKDLKGKPGELPAGENILRPKKKD